MVLDQGLRSEAATPSLGFAIIRGETPLREKAPGLHDRRCIRVTCSHY